MDKILIAGAGKIGSLIALLLSKSGDYQVWLADLNFSGADNQRLSDQVDCHKITIDVQDAAAMQRLCTEQQFTAIISSLPYFCNPAIAELARQFNAHYFDLTEDTTVTAAVKHIAHAATTAFVPQCGLAPGFISIVANSLMQQFEQVREVKLRVGALPVNSNNALQYSLTWSTDGVINEYGNPCQALHNGKKVLVMPLEGLEFIQIDGMKYEAFNTSGGLGSLVELYHDKIGHMNYKTIRYPGHCSKMKLLMNDLKLNEDRGTLKRILENAIPKTYQDVVLIYVTVIGMQQGELLEQNYVNKVYPRQIDGHVWSAIQVTTAAGICTVVDEVLQHSEHYAGFVYQEQIPLDRFLQNRFGKLYDKSI